MAETAWSGHLPYAHYLIRTLKPKVVVELGTHRGPSYFAMCQTVKAYKLNTKTYAVDTWQGEAHAGFYDESVYNSVKKENEKYTAFSTLLRCTFDDALKQFEDGTVDLLHIDGFHTYEAVKHDFETWLPKLAKGATVIFHDTNERKEDFGVYRLWEELMKKYDGFEFKHSHGLGVLQLPGAKVNLVPKPAQLAEHLSVFEAAGLLSDAQMIEKQHGYLPSAIAVTKLIRRVKAMESSTSWKVTSPLRSVTGLLKKK
ncbi:MAG: class I SAM-dependent methyltransferase [Micrococcales bacterium]